MKSAKKINPGATSPRLKKIYEKKKTPIAKRKNVGNDVTTMEKQQVLSNVVLEKYEKKSFFGSNHSNTSKINLLNIYSTKLLKSN